MENVGKSLSIFRLNLKENLFLDAVVRKKMNQGSNQVVDRTLQRRFICFQFAEMHSMIIPP